METTENTTTELVQVEQLENDTPKELKIVVPKLVPDILEINGIKSSQEILEKAKSEIKAIKIKDIADEKNYALAVEKLDQVKKAIREEEKWRKKFFDPFLKFKKELDTRITKTNLAEYEEMKKHLEAEIKPIDDWKELEKERIINENKAKAESRAVILVENGMVFNGAGTYRFPENLDQSVFVLQDELGEMTDEEFEAKLSEVKPIWDAEVERVAKVKADEEKAQLEKDRLIADVNEERTEFRKEKLSDLGFEFDADLNMWFKEGFTAISDRDVLNANKDYWKELLAPKQEAKEETPIVGLGDAVLEETPIVFDHVNETVKFEEPATEAVSFDEPLAEPVTFDTVEEVKFEEAIAPIMEHKSLEPTNDVILEFDNEHPFQDSEAVEGFKLRMFHKDTEDLAMEGIDQSEDGSVAFTTTIGLLKFALIKA